MAAEGPSENVRPPAVTAEGAAVMRALADGASGIVVLGPMIWDAPIVRVWPLNTTVPA